MKEKNKPFDFWTAANENYEKVKDWPDWKKDIRLTPWSPGILENKTTESAVKEEKEKI